MKKRFSILVPAYKTDMFIENTLDSIEKQTYFLNNNNYEVLIGVDNCVDTLEKLKKIRHNYRNVKIFMMEKNMGLFVNINTLFSLADSENIIKFDSDDIMKPNLISTISNYTDIYDIIRFSSDNFQNDINKIIKRGIVAHGSSYIKKSLYEKLGGYKNWKCAADTDFLYRSEGVSKHLLMKTSLFYRRIHPNSLTESYDTGRNSSLRKEYIKQLKRGYEYVSPVVNNYKEIL